MFRFETFGTEGFWTDAVRMPQGMKQAKVTPLDALKAGLSVDSERIPPALKRKMARELRTDLSPRNAPLLNNPATTTQLINATAVIGIVPRGVWVWWEVRADMDASGHGSFRLWLNGVMQNLRPSYSGPPPATDYQFTWPGEPVGFTGTMVNNTYGGSLTPVPHAQRIWIDAHSTAVP